jgi:hypothetical protein
MKKTTIALFVALIASAAFAQIPRRVVELGNDLRLGASNNYLTLNDVFQETLVIDLNELAARTALTGFCVNADAGADFFLNLALPKDLGVGLFLGSSVYAFSSLPAELFQLLSKGNQIGTESAGSMRLLGDVFVEVGAKASKGLGPWTFSLSPAFFMPAAHIDNPTASYSLIANADGTVAANAQANIPIYSAVSIDSLAQGLDFQAIATGILNSGGLDASLGASYQLLPELRLGATLAHVPIVPATLRNRLLVTASADASLDDLLGSFGTAAEADMFAYESESAMVYDAQSVQVMRPFKFGVQAVYVPAALKFLTVSGNLALGAYQGAAYMDLGVKARADLANILIAYVSTAYEDRIWRNELGLALNLRILELDFTAGLQSAEFLTSFMGSGFYAALGSRVGF